MQLYLLKYLVLVQAALFLGNILKAPTRQVLRNIPGCEMNWEGCFLLHQVSTFNFQHGGFGSQGFQNFMVLICHLVITECYFGSLLNTVRERPRTSVAVREVILTARGQYCSSLAIYLPLLT